MSTAPPPPTPTAPAPVARGVAIVGLVLAIASALLAVLWMVAIPLGIVALGVSWLATQRAKGRDLRSTGIAVAGIAAAIAGILLGLAGLAWGGESDSASDPTTINGIETSTPDAAHPPQLDVDAGATCTVDLDGLRAEGTITNRSDRTWAYGLRVVWEEDGDLLAEGTALLGALTPGASAPFKVVSPVQGTSATECRVAQIERSTP